MKHKKIFLICIVLLTIVTIGGVSAEDNAVNDSASENICGGDAGEIFLEDAQIIEEYSQDAPLKSSPNDNDENGDTIKNESLNLDNSDLLSSNESENNARENFTIEFCEDYHIYGETNFFGFLMPKDIENNVSVEIDGKTYDYEVCDINNPEQWVWSGDAQTQMGYMVKFSDLSIGDHEVIISYPGDARYAESSLVRNITVHDGSNYNTGNETFKIGFYHDSFTYGETNFFGFLMPKDITGNISVKLDWKDYDYEACDISNPDQWKWEGDTQTQRGYIVKFSDLKSGNHNLFILYSGDDKYAPISMATYLKVNSKTVDNEKEYFTIEFYDDYHTYGETNIFGFLMPKDIENNVSVVIDGKSYDYEVYDVDDLNLWVWGGDAKTQSGYMVKFSDLKPGNHQVVITYEGDYKYVNNTLVKTITVNGEMAEKMPTKLTADSITAYYNGGKYLVATLKDGNGNPIKKEEIQFKINGNVQKVKTDSQGHAKLTTNKLIPKEYSVIVSYGGGDYYKPSTVKAKVIIKKAVSKITAGKKTFKKSTKTKKYTITLKANGKAMKNAWVSLKVNKKTYKVKTNSNGKATFKITNLKKKGTFTAAVKYGSKYYASKTVKAKITVK